LARALLADFTLILLDEPTANVDEAQSMSLVKELIEVAKDKQGMLVLITHDNKLAELADRKIEL
jgi:ABC-type lipoprotein export system ATPase subunit